MEIVEGFTQEPITEAGTYWFRYVGKEGGDTINSWEHVRLCQVEKDTLQFRIHLWDEEYMDLPKAEDEFYHIMWKKMGY